MYGLRSNGGEHGSVATRDEVVEFMLDVVGYMPTKDLSQVTVLDPAGGDGRFIASCFDRLYLSVQKFGFDFVNALNNLRIVEIDNIKVNEIRVKLQNKLRSKQIDDLSSLENVIITDDFLLMDLHRLNDASEFDIVIGNPPYIRHENIPTDKKEVYRKTFKTFRYRSDIYICFYERGLELLSNDGQLCYICANRWLKNQFGQPLRNFISQDFNVPLIINLEQAKPFVEDVDAYAAITLITRQKNNTANYFEVININDLDKIRDFRLFKEVINNNQIKMERITIRRDRWRFYKELVHESDKSFLTIEEQGFKIGIGIATGSDKIFVRKDFKEIVESELLLPIILSKDVRKGTLEWSGHYLLNPYKNGSNSLINLDCYPKAKQYFSENKKALLKRYVAKKQPQKWFKTIDRVNLNLLHSPKLLLPDMKKTQKIVLDPGGFYPHHNIYYITDHDINTLKVIGTFLMSNFVKNQLSEISVLMRGGYVRWQCQNIKKIRIPKLKNLNNEEKRHLVALFDNKKVDKINEVISQIVTVRKLSKPIEKR